VRHDADLLVSLYTKLYTTYFDSECAALNAIYAERGRPEADDEAT